MNSSSARSKHRKTKANSNSKAPKTWFFNIKHVLSALLIVFAVWFAQQVYSWHLMRLVITPFDSVKPLAVNYSAYQWGTVKSGYYLGIKSLSPYSISSGLMWFRNEVVENSIPIRHWCSQGDHLQKYTWLQHDFDNFGVQEIVDGNIKLETKVILNEDNGWKVKVSVSHISTTDVKPISLVWYWRTEAENDFVTVHQTNDMNVFYTSGHLLKSGNFSSSVHISKRSNVLYKSRFSSGFSPQHVDLKETVLQNLFWLQTKNEFGDIFALKQNADVISNVVMYQIVAIPPFDFVVNFKMSPDLEKTPSRSEVSDFDSLLKTKQDEFDSKFEDIFHLKEKGYGKDEINFAKAAVSNMIGSIGYFYGSSVVQSKYNEKPVKYGPLQLLTAVPSRSFFPRGFLWDEGFHNLVISKFKPYLSVSIINSWFNLMNVEGWIPREVILGRDSEARVPQEFIVQNNTNGNPPALFIALKNLLDTNILSEKQIEALFPRLQLWFTWFNTSQIGLRESSYRWRGRHAGIDSELNTKTLTSGLDDYPRASHPTDDEYHLDLRCWMAFASKVMAELAEKIRHPSHLMYQENAMHLYDNNLLEELHWSSEFNMFCDVGMHSLNVKLVKTKSSGPQIKPKTQRKVISKPRFGCVPEFGYISLFPFILTILEPTNPKLQSILSNIRNEDLLWTPFGLRSLAKNSIYYRKYNTEVDPPYWRGAVWININFLVLKALKYYGETDGPHRNESVLLYSQLRSNIVNNIYKQYVKTGYIWEQYDDLTGEGKGSHPFTGWSSLVVLIMSEKF
ncbi:mannosyl-oligosaccharide glucosidase-like isoform X1 [Leptotrombidium deliense]|uniref:Mannosyl-oligosaccharide glucosidase n=1 Tax=Leptotrombidium deliense TaxID=299467 RepID=A0A443SUY2_9ACAR|nr:mannosyl-oligosaccharide glucosidase-like isoform X1 [Leptotrombidium deliense]